MRKIGLVLVREYLENVRTRAFLIAVLMTPVLGALCMLVPKWAAGQPIARRTIVVVDMTGVLENGVRENLEKVAAADGHRLFAVEGIPLQGTDAPSRAKDFEAHHRVGLDGRVTNGEIFAYVVVRPSALDKRTTAESPSSRLVTSNLAEITVSEHVHLAIDAAANEHFARAHGLPEDSKRILSSRAPYSTQSVIAETRAGNIAVTIAPIVVMFVLFLTIVGTSQALITSTLEEKSNRVVEVLLSSVSPFQLMAGKVLGVCAVGLTLMLIWGTAGGAALAAQGFLGVVPGDQLLLLFVYYLLGFLLIASLMVAVGSACNTLKEAQNLLSPLMIVLALPMLLLVIVMRDPQGPVATWLSFFPLFTPFLMMMRIGAVPPPPPAQIVGSIALLAASTALAIWLAARVFRVGILLYGKPPTLREIFRWMRSGA